MSIDVGTNRNAAVYSVTLESSIEKYVRTSYVRQRTNIALVYKYSYFYVITTEIILSLSCTIAHVAIPRTIRFYTLECSDIAPQTSFLHQNSRSVALMRTCVSYLESDWILGKVQSVSTFLSKPPSWIRGRRVP